MSGYELMAMGVSTGMQAGAQLRQAKLNRQVAKINAEQAETDAQHVRIAAAIDAEQATEEAERSIGRALVAAGASGLAIDGSALDVLADLGAQKRFNASTLIYAGELERNALLREASFGRASARMQQRGATLGAAATVLTGGYRMSQVANLDGG